jgi:NAD(P)-dependent dehydrogenase (short-subunit alcohol dehydrogenase family)
MPVLSTGVSRHIGIGAAIARSFAASGANIFTTYIMIDSPAREKDFQNLKP